jgi:hypothetical protein
MLLLRSKVLSWLLDSWRRVRLVKAEISTCARLLLTNERERRESGKCYALSDLMSFPPRFSACRLRHSLSQFGISFNSTLINSMSLMFERSR